MPALVGKIFAGFFLGPPLADFVPYPEALVLVGEIGLIMLLLEAGVELDVAQLRETGLRAMAIGVTGTMLLLLVGMGLGWASGSASTLKSALAVGASFSPTSLGVAASALKVQYYLYIELHYTASMTEFLFSRYRLMYLFQHSLTIKYHSM